MKIASPIPAIHVDLIVNNQIFIFTTAYNHLLGNKKILSLKHKATGRYLGACINKKHAISIAQLYLQGNEPLSMHDTVVFLKKEYGHMADFESAMSGSTYMRIKGKTVRISDHDSGAFRTIPDLDLPIGLGRKGITEAIDNLLK